MLYLRNDYFPPLLFGVSPAGAFQETSFSSLDIEEGWPRTINVSFASIKLAESGLKTILPLDGTRSLKGPSSGTRTFITRTIFSG
jgi:hypothetical protein